MAKPILIDVDLNQNELQNAAIQNLASPPANPVAGQIYFNTVSSSLKIFNGTTWEDVGEISLVDLGVTATAEELNILDGATITTTELNYVDGVTSNIQDQLDDKLELNSISATAPITYNSSTGVIAANVDTSATLDSPNLITSGAVYSGLSVKLDANSPITGGTFTKVTVDSDGLVTAGDTLVASDIPDLSATYVLQSEVGVSNGIAELDADGKVPTSQLPSYVDDVIDAYIVTGSTPLSAGWLSTEDGGSALTPDTGVIYVVLTSGDYQNKTYRWSGSTYVEISASPAQATESQAGIAEIATSAEVTTGTDDTKIVTPYKLKGVTETLQPLLVSGTNIKTINSDSLLGSGNINLQTPQTTLAGYGITDANINNGVITLGNNTITPLTEHQTLSDLGITATAEELNTLDGITATTTELNYVDGVTSNIQTQLNNKTTVITANNPALTPSGGAASWTISNTIGTTSVIVQVVEIASGNVVMTDINISSSNIIIGINASSTIVADTYRAVIIGI